MPPADGLILVDAPPGPGQNTLRRLNPSVLNDAEIISENQIPKLDPDLDPFNPDNGYNAEGASSYSEAFQLQYFAAQARRMNALIDIARAKLEAIESIGEPYPDDDVFLIAKGNGADITLFLDSSVHHTTQRPQKLLRNDGTIVRQIVESVRLPDLGGEARNGAFNGGTRLLTVRSFLSTNAIRASDSISDIDYCSSNNSVSCAVQVISVPLLITAMGAGGSIRANEIYYERAKSEDKDFVLIEGALHQQLPCVECESFPGQYSNVTENFFNYASDWIDARY